MTEPLQNVTPEQPRWKKLWQYTKGIASDDQLFIQSTAIKGGGVVAVMVGALYMIPAAAGLPWVLAAGVVGAGAVVIGVGVAGVVMGAGALANSLKRIVRDVDQVDVEKKLTLDEARKGLQKKFQNSGFVRKICSLPASKYISQTRGWKMAMKNWNRAQSFIADNGIFIKSFAVAGSAANIAAGVLMLASGTVLFPLILGGAATIATVGIAVGSIGWGLAAAYVLAKNIVGGSKEKDKPVKVKGFRKQNRQARRLAANLEKKVDLEKNTMVEPFSQASTKQVLVPAQELAPLTKPSAAPTPPPNS